MSNIKYKKPLTIEEQVDYLEKNKHVVYNITTKQEAKIYLYNHNYINVVSPFKERFARHDEKNAVVRDNDGNHIYDYSVEFSMYQDLYNLERMKYPIIYSNIMKFETAFNAIVSYEVINHYEIKDEIRFKMFIEILQKNIDSFVESGRIKSSTANHMHNDISKFESLMDNYNSIYIFMDRLSLSQVITVYRAINVSLHNKIFNSLLNSGLTFGYKSSGSFDDFLSRVVPIRNCIAHFNSLEIVIKYYDIKNKGLRHEADRNRYKKVIAKLIEYDKSPQQQILWAFHLPAKGTICIYYLTCILAPCQ